MMKKILLGIVAILLIGANLIACSFDKSLNAAVPGKVELCANSSDVMGLAGYNSNVDADSIKKFNVLDVQVDVLYIPPETKTLIFKGKTYETSFLISKNLFMRNYSYDVYMYKNPETDEMMEFHVVSGTNDEIVGYRYNVSVSQLTKTASKSEDELIQIATAALSEFTNANYYKNVSIQSWTNYNVWKVEFYNTIGDIRVADSSYVELTMDGEVIAVEALPEPAILKAARYSKLDRAQFDAALETQMEQAYPDYLRDDAEMFSDIKYDGTNIQSCCITLDNNGNPIVVYYATPKLKYDILYRGDAAQVLQEKSIDVHETGVYEPPVYGVIYIE
ncbi:MAG: hypothetical protein IJY27_03975 [Clostridia bacterium]|nr:hypothetical protein [Clostridia bacterium]